MAGEGVGVDADVGAGVGRYDGVPPETAWEATPWRRADARSGFEIGGALVDDGAPAVGRRYILSIVGRRAAPKGVDRKSVGRSGGRIVFPVLFM